MSPTMVWILGLVTSLIGGGGWLAKLAANRAWLRDFLDRVTRFREDVVMELEQTMRPKVEEACTAASAGGVDITATELTNLRNVGVAKLKDYLGVGAIERALKLMKLPFGLPIFVDQWLITQVESTVQRLTLKQRAAIGAGGVVNNAVVSS